MSMFVPLRLVVSCLVVFCLPPSQAEKEYVSAADLWKSEAQSYNEFQVFCHKPQKSNLAVTRSLSSVYFEVTPNDKDHWPTFYHGRNASHVQAMRDSRGILPTFSMETLWPSLSRRLSPIDESCLGVDSDRKYHVKSRYRVVDGLYLGLFVAGLTIILGAQRFSRSVYFHYSSGVTIGVLASLLVVVYVMSRFIPKKLGAGAFLLGGWAIVIAFIRQILESFFTSEYRDYIAAYFVVAGIISFIVCYWYGPVQNERTMHILEGALYIIGSALMFYAIQHRPTALVIIALIAAYKYFKRSGVLARRPRWPRITWFTFWRRWRRPPKRRRLTMDEFDHEGEENTRTALDELREYCNSPQCNPWKMIARMDTPDRFAKFVLGEDHVSDTEMTLYESDVSLPPENSLLNDSLLTSDSD